MTAINFLDDLAANRVVSSAVAAELLNISEDTLRRMRARGDAPPCIKISPRRVGFRLRDIEGWLNDRTRSRGEAVQG